jgi:hypothetical protein
MDHLFEGTKKYAFLPVSGRICQEKILGQL